MAALRTVIIEAGDRDYLQRALDELKAGGLVAFPTDTVYGLGAMVFDEAAVQAIYRAKDRPIEKAIPVLLSDANQMDHVAADVPATARQLAAHFWPGPLTLVIPKRADLPASVSATGTVGVRVPDHHVARELLRAAGPMAVTSANLSGAESPSTAQAVMAQLGGRIAIIVDGGKTPGGVPSTVVDCTTAPPQIVREGPIPLEDLLKIL